MDKPTKLAFSDEATFTFLRGETLGPFIIIFSIFLVVLVTGEVTLADLALPAGAMSIGLLGWTGIFVLIALGHRFGEVRGINRLFWEEIWECWQFSSSDWQNQVEGVCNLISPRDEGLEAYQGAVYSSIFGIIIAIFLIVVTFFAIDDPEIKFAMYITAGFVFLLIAGIGLFQPQVAKYRANRYRRKALKFPEPRVWFGRDGVYHEALGHTSLKELHRVTDQTKSRNAIRFTVVVSSDTYDDLVKIRFPVPPGCEERAGILVRRYRQEHSLA